MSEKRKANEIDSKDVNENEQIRKSHTEMLNDKREYRMQYLAEKGRRENECKMALKYDDFLFSKICHSDTGRMNCVCDKGCEAFHCSNEKTRHFCCNNENESHQALFFISEFLKILLRNRTFKNQVRCHDCTSQIATIDSTLGFSAFKVSDSFPFHIEVHD